MLQPAHPLTTKTTAPITLAPTSTLSCRHSRTQEQQQQQNHCRTKPPKWNHPIAAVDLIGWSHYAIAAVDLVEWSHYVRGGTIPSKPPKMEPCDCSSCSFRMEPFVEEPSHQSHQNRTIRLQLLICSNGATTCVEEPCDCSRCSFLSNVAFTQSAGTSKQQSAKKVMRLVFILATDDGQRKRLYQFYSTYNKSHTCSF